MGMLQAANTIAMIANMTITFFSLIAEDIDLRRVSTLCDVDVASAVTLWRFRRDIRSLTDVKVWNGQKWSYCI